ncbi:unnamed protein product [Rhizophagus irregularis]|nr:unnamed protein product [Rhizophagus irregularis]
MRDRISSRKENEIVAIKGFEDSDHFLNEIKSSHITWNKEKLYILWQISEGLENIHNSNFIHRDIHRYITKAYELDINNIPRPITSNIITSRKRKIEESADVENHDNSGKHIKINRNSSL